MEEITNKEHYYQCNVCGKIHLSNIEKVYDLNDDIYYATYCPRCKKVVKHLWVGQDEDDVYMWADPVFDERYY